MALAQPAREQSFIMVRMRLCSSLSVHGLLTRMSHSVSRCGGSTTNLFCAQVKPDGVQRGKVADIIRRFEVRGFKLVGIKASDTTTDVLSACAIHMSSCTSRVA